MNLKQQLGQKIRQMRNQKKYTQAQLAEKVGIATKHQSCIETGKNFPSAELLEKYAKVFKKEACELLSLSSNKNREELIGRIVSMLNDCTIEEIKMIYKLLMR